MALTAAVRVEQMTDDDIPAVLDIERASFLTPWPPEAFQQEVRHNRLARYLVARQGGAVVGYAGVWLMVDEAHITTFAVHPEWRRQGIGRRLLLAMLVVAEEMRATRMTLEVRVSNLAAQALYRDHGFAIAGRRERYYTDDGEDAYVMTTPPLTSAAMREPMDAARQAAAEADADEPADR
ncbi:MAG TPA: ribosomal protein S18-alanine N-acetyltransferase [Candidatus Limnocylindria bacterium]